MTRQTKLLEHYCEQVDAVFEAHQAPMKVCGGNVDGENGIITIKAPLAGLGFDQLEMDLAKALEVSKCHLYLTIEIRREDN